MWSRISCFLIILVLASSCKTRKKISIPTGTTPTALSAADASAIKSFELSNLDFHSFSGKAKTKIEMGDNSQDVSLNLRIERDKAIWVSVTALLGVEVARILITPDSIKVLNKFQGEYLAKPFNYIHHYTNKGVTFGMLQDLLMANVSPNLLRTDQVQVASAQDEFIVVGIKDDLSYQYRLNKDNRPFNFLLQRVGVNQNLEAYYNDFVKTIGYNFPQKITLNMTGDFMKLKAQMSFSKVEFNEKIEMPFSVSSRYKVVE